MIRGSAVSARPLARSPFPPPPPYPPGTAPTPPPSPPPYPPGRAPLPPQELAYGTLGLQYVGIPEGEKPKDNEAPTFGYAMYQAWQDGNSNIYKDMHRQRTDYLQHFFQVTLSANPGYKILGELLSRFALTQSLATRFKQKGAIPSALVGNPCLADEGGLFGVALLDFEPETGNKYAQAVFDLAANDRAMFVEVCQHCQLQVRSPSFCTLNHATV